MPSLNQEFSNKGSTSLMYFSTGQSYLFTLHLEYSIIHFNVTIIFTSTSKLCGRLALMWIRPRLLRPHLLKSIRPMTNNTLQHRLLKMLFAWIILPPLLKQVKRFARSQKCRRQLVDLKYILYKVVTAKCCGSLCAVTFTLTLIH